MKKIFYIILLIVILIVVSSSTIAICKFTNVFKYNKKKLRKEIYYGLDVINKVFNKNNIYYIIGDGTLLGAVRHWKMIEWDDDADLYVFHKDIDKIMSLKDEFKKYGLILKKEWKLLKILFNDKEYPAIDLFIINDNNGKIERCKTNTDICEKVYINDHYVGYPSKWIRKRKKYIFGKLSLYGPVKPIRLLKHWFGDDVLTKCMSHNYCHITNRYIEPKIIKCKNLPKPQI